MSTEIVDYPHGFSTLIPTTDQGAPSLPTALPSQGWVELVSRAQPVRLVFEGARLQPCHKPSPKQGDSAPEVNLRNPTQHEISNIIQLAKLAAGQSPIAESLRLTLWIVRSGRPSLLGDAVSVELPPLRLTSYSCEPPSFNQAPHRRNAQIFSRSQPHCNSLRVPPFEAFRKPNALPTRSRKSTSLRPR